jgi:prevent-host-death family protein
LAKRLSSAEAKAQFSSLVDDVARGGARYIIERRGKPLAALVSVAELEQIERTRSQPVPPAGFLALVGAWGDLPTDEEIDRMTEEIYAQRERVPGLTIENWLS